MGDFRNQQRSERRREKFTFLTKSLREILALDKGKFKAPSLMMTPTNRGNDQRWKAGTPNQGDKARRRKGLAKGGKKEETSGKDKAMEILMVQPWQKVAKQRITQSFSPDQEILFPPLGEEDGTEGPMIIEAEIRGYFIHRMYVDGGSSSEILYEHCFKRLRPEVKNQMVPATTPLIGFSGEVIWPMGQILLPVKIGDVEHSTSTWMNFVIVRSPSPYNRIIGRPRERIIQAVPSTAHGMLKFPLPGGVLTLRSSRIILLECVMVFGPEAQSSNIVQTAKERIKVAIHPEYQEQTIMIGLTLTEEGQKALCDLLRHNLAEAAFKQMKQLIAELPTLTAPMENDELIVYLEAAQEAVSIVLMTGREAKQMLVYFVSRALQGPEINYTPMEKLVLAIVHANFIVERLEDGSPDTPIEVDEKLPNPWTLFTDGSSCVDGSGAGLIFTDPEGVEFTYALRFRFDATNNETEYEALIAGLRIAEQMGVKNLQVSIDSHLVANQVNGSYIAKEPVMVEKVKMLSGNFKKFSIKQGVLYKKSFLRPWLCCVGPLQADYVLREIHEGSCSMHAGIRSVVSKALRTGYYWPTMHKDARTLIKVCQDCQVHQPVLKNPQQKLTPITSSWPFYKWGIDIAGPFPEGHGKVKFLIVAIDYFTKWIEAKPIATITGNQVKQFVWDNIVCRFELPGEIISDNGK
ncbi:reverse transcriptase domain-containing protein [Tanacetum coccineum]